MKSDKIAGVRAGVVTGMDKYESAITLSEPLRKIQQRIWAFHLSSLHNPERHFFAVAPTSRRDRDCVGLLARGYARTDQKLPAPEKRKRRGSNLISSVLWFSFPFRQLFSRGTFYRLRGEIRGGFSLSLPFLLQGTLPSSVQVQYRGGQE